MSTLSYHLVVLPVHSHNETRLTTRMHSGVLKLPARHTWRFQWDYKGRNALDALASSPDSSSTIIGKNTVGDPLFGSIDNVYIAPSLCGCRDPSYIRSGCT